MKEFRNKWIHKEIGTIKREFTSEPPRKIILNVLYIFLGACVSAFGDSFFTIPLNIVSGGISSLSIISHSVPGRNRLSTEIYVLIFTWSFFLLGLIFVGLKTSGWIHTTLPVREDRTSIRRNRLSGLPIFLPESWFPARLNGISLPIRKPAGRCFGLSCSR